MASNELNPLYRTLVGFDRIASLMDQAARLDGAPGYPPFNIEQTSEDAFRIELAVAVRKAVPDCKVLLLSGQAVTSNLSAKVSNAGHQHFNVLMKPIHPDDLLAETSRLFGQS